MKRIFFRLIALFFPTRKMRARVRHLGDDQHALLIQSGIDMVKETMDFSKLPPAHGYLRLTQQMNIKLLAAFTKFCDLNGIENFLIGGAIIGKLRHNGLIPWDDDIDIAIPDPHWHKLVDILRNTELGDDYCIYFGTRWNMLKICHMPTGLFVDIFRFSLLDSDITFDNHQEYTNRKHAYSVAHTQMGLNLYRKHAVDIFPGDTFEQKNAKIDKILEHVRKEEDLFNKHVLAGQQPQTGCGLAHFSADSKPNEVFPYAVIYPLKKIEFEGYEFSFPNNLDDYAYIVWGDIWCFPEQLVMHQSGKPDIKKYLIMRHFLETPDETIFSSMFKTKGK